MKTLGKLEINHERILKNEELKSLKGGYWEGTCYVYDGFGYLVYQYPASGTSEYVVESWCTQQFWQYNCICQ